MADIDISKQSKTPYIIVTLITVVLIIGWGLYLIYANNNQVFPFTPFTPPEGDNWVYPKGSTITPLTAEEQAQFQAQLLQGIDEVKRSISYNKKK